MVLDGAMTGSALTEVTRPPRLQSGDVVALVAPSGPVTPHRLDAGIAILEAWGLEVRELPHVRTAHATNSYLAGGDAERADDFTRAWCDPDVSAVLCVRGGYGAQRMVDLVDWAALRGAAPKVLVGYSDITALHLAVGVELGLVSLHGPMTSTGDFLDSPAAQEHLRRSLFEPEAVQVLGRPGAGALVGGTATGITVGGCLSLLATSVGVPSAPRSAAGGIVVIEDLDEKAYRLDSFLTQLRRAGWFDGAAGVALGSWQGCEPIEPVALDVLGDLGIPILSDLGFGHGPDPLTVPLGVAADLDADAGTLTLHHPALS